MRSRAKWGEPDCHIASDLRVRGFSWSPCFSIEKCLPLVKNKDYLKAIDRIKSNHRSSKTNTNGSCPHSPLGRQLALSDGFRCCLVNTSACSFGFFIMMHARHILFRLFLIQSGTHRG